MDSNEHAEHPSGKSADQTVLTAAQPDANGEPLSLQPDRIAKNTSYLTIALMVQKVLSLVYYVIVANALGPENNGMYLTALTVSGLFGFFIDLGLSQVLIRETARRREETTRYLNTIFTLKSVTTIAVVTALAIYAFAFPYPSLTRTLILVMAASMVLDSFALTFYAIFRGHQRLQYESFGTVANKVIVMAIGIYGLHRGWGPLFAILALLIGSGFNFFYSGALLVWRYRWMPRWLWDKPTIRMFVKIAIPFAVTGIFVTAYNFQDQILIGHPLLVGSRGPSYVAWYSTAYKLAMALQFFPLAVAAATFPAMSAYFVSDKVKLKKTFERAMEYLMILAMPIALGIITLGGPIILRLYTRSYAASIIPLQILAVSIPFLFLNFPVGYLLNACDRQTRNTVNTGIVTVVNLILNLILIPRMTFIGAAIASTISTILLFTLGFIVVRQIVPYSRMGLFHTFWKSLLSAGVMTSCIISLRPVLSLTAVIGIGIAAYIIVLYAVRGFRISDGMTFYRAVRRKQP